ncbi:MAG: hypothetical protein NTW21_38425 [Verrucomicrobia bacterium]|nr:hypothetical protein [Verrucomicrobiota bacterium]
MRPETIRSFAAIALLTGCNANAAAAAGTPAGSTMITMDYAKYLAPINLHFTKPADFRVTFPVANAIPK